MGCKGLIFRFTSNSFLSKHGSIEDRKSLRLLKKDSCTGCPKCEWTWDYLREDISCMGDDYLKNLIPDQKYRMNFSGSWEELEHVFERVVKNNHSQT